MIWIGRSSRSSLERKDVITTSTIFSLSILCLMIVLGSNSLLSPLSPYAGHSPQSGSNDTSNSSSSKILSNETGRGTQKVQFWYVGASSQPKNGPPNNGLSSIIQVESQDRIPGVLSFWVSEAMSNNLWAQVGYFLDNGSHPLAFYQIWNLGNRSEIATGTTEVSAGLHSFSMTVLSKGNVWQFRVDSKAFGSFDMQTNLSNPNYPMYAMSEEGYTPTPFAFSQVLFSSAIQVLYSGVWHNETSALSFGNAWEIQGYEQNSLLSPNEILVGGLGTQGIGNTISLWG